MDIIDKINSAEKIEDVISIADFKAEFNKVMKEIHPDVCKDSGAPEAAAKMNAWKDIFENGKEYKDDLGAFRTNGYWAEYKSDSKNLVWSIENYRLFMQLKGKPHDHFQKYLPKEGILSANGAFRLKFDKRAIPISGLTLPQEHVNWILNRLLEYSAYLAESGFSHCGLNPESVFIVPENHGIQICSFYHLTRLGNKVGTIPGRYSHWYPKSMYSKKVATESVDIECSKRIAAYLLGDKSGNGGKLRKIYNDDFINFILSSQDNPYQAMMSYKDLLKKNFESKFYSLTI